MTLQDCLRVLRRRRTTMAVSAAIVILGALAAVLVLGALQSRSSIVQSRLLVMGQVAEHEQYAIDTAPAAAEISQALVESASTDSVLWQIGREAGVTRSIQSLRSAIDVTNVSGAPSVQIEAIAATPEAAEELNIAVLTTLTDMANNLAQERLTGETGVMTRVVMEPLLLESSSLPVIPIAVFAAVFAVAVAVGAALVRDLVDPRVRDAETVGRRAPGVAVVTSAAAARARIVAAGGGSTVLVAAVSDGQDTSETARDVASRLASWGEAVVLAAAGGSGTDLGTVEAVPGTVTEVSLGGAEALSERLAPPVHAQLRSAAGDGGIVVLAGDLAAWDSTFDTLPTASRVAVAVVEPGRTLVSDVETVARKMEARTAGDAFFVVC